MADEIIEAPQASEVYEKPQNLKTKGLPSGEVKKWQSRIEASRKFRDEALKYMVDYINAYSGLHWEETEELLDKPMINLIFADIKKEMPNLYFQNPLPIVTPRRKEYELSAFALQELMKFYVKYNMGTELKRHVRLAILDSKFAFGTLKCTYTPYFAPNPNKGKPVLLGYTPDKMPVFNIVDGSVQMEDSEIIVSELYYIERVCPTEMLFDINIRNFVERSGWLGQEIVKPLSYLKNNSLYSNTEDLEPNVELEEIFKDKDEEAKNAARILSDDDDKKLVRFVEIHDIKNGEILCLPDGYDKFIRKIPSYINPYSFLKFNEKPDSWYPVSDVKQQIAIQAEINIMEYMQLSHAKRSARKYFYDDTTFSGVDEVEGIEAMKDARDMTLVKVSDISKAPVVAQLAVQDPSIFQSIVRLQDNFNTVSGGTEAGTGFTQRRKTKGEAQFQEAHGSIRITDKQNLVADFMSDAYMKLGKIIQATMTKEQAIKVVGKVGAFWVNVKSQDIQGELFFEVDVAEMRPQIPELDKQEINDFVFSLSNLLNAVATNPIFAKIINLQGLIKQVAKNYPSIKVEEILNGQFTPEQIAEEMDKQNANV